MKSFLVMKLAACMCMLGGEMSAGNGADPAAMSPVGTPDVLSTSPVFDLPRIEEEHRQVLQRMLALAVQQRFRDVEQLLLQALENPDTHSAVMVYNLACVRAVLGERDAALDSLEKAIAMGFRNVEHFRNDSDLDSLRGDSRYQALEAMAAENPSDHRTPAVALPIRDQTARINTDNTAWVSSLQRFLVLHEALPAADGDVGVRLLYDNRDRGHSRMNINTFTGIARIVYSKEAVNADLDRGAQVSFLHNIPVIGNASLASTSGAYWRSMTRRIYQDRNPLRMLADQYVNNHLYFYPEHRDHSDGFGDVFPANTPYVITSQGSSGSDRPFLQAVARTVLAFTPETYQFLVQRNLLMPTVQMIFRKTRTPVKSAEDYLSGKAHPAAFARSTLDVERMIAMAKTMMAADVPPLIRLQVESEDDDTQPGIDYFEAGPGEKLFDSISAIARVARATRHERRMVVSVEQTSDPNGRPLQFGWRVLRGDKDRVWIRPLNAEASRVELRVAWHERAVREGIHLPSSRVDIGVFAHNGVHYSAPGFVTWYFPANEKRTYDETGRIRSVAFLPPASAGSYVDPAIVTPAAWTDTYRYTQGGQLLGWERRRDGKTEMFTRQGELVLESDTLGRPVLAQRVVYQRVQAGERDWPSLRQVARPERVTYAYQSDDDLLGSPLAMPE